MTGERYLVIGYIVGFGLLLGYAILLWIGRRALERRERRKQGGATR
jgi:hypothetical protein